VAVSVMLDVCGTVGLLLGYGCHDVLDCLTFALLAGEDETRLHEVGARLVWLAYCELFFHWGHS
jgi:hypothetical protein